MALRIGLIARCDNRGIAYQTLEFFRHMRPTRTLVVMMNDRRWPEDPSRFYGPGTRIINSSMTERALPEREVRSFLEAVDVVFAVETVYEWQLCEWAREYGTKVVIQANPELWHNHHTADPHPDQWWWPTPWMIDHPDLPIGPVIPVPCVDRPPIAADAGAEVLRVLHVAGVAAAGDRNGTLAFIEALSYVRQRVHVTITSQMGAPPRDIKPARNVTISFLGETKDRWEMYENQHVLVAPRRYGGLSLPTLEAMSCGLAVAMPKFPPNTIWPIEAMPTRKGRMQRTKFGVISTAAVQPRDIAATIDGLARDRVRLYSHMHAAEAFAIDNSWARLAPTYLSAMEAIR